MSAVPSASAFAATLLQDNSIGIGPVLPEDMASLCAWRLGQRQEALAFARRAASLAPHVERITGNLARLEALLGQHSASSGYGQTTTRRL